MTRRPTRVPWVLGASRWLLAGGAAAALAFGSGGLALAWSGGSSSGGQGAATSMSGTLYYTRFVTSGWPCPVKISGAAFCGGDPSNVGTVSFSYAHGQLALGTPTDLATVPAADGIAFSPQHTLLVGGQFTGDVFDVNPTSGTYTKVAAGTSTAYMVGLSPDGMTAYIGSVGSGDVIGVLNLSTNPPTEETPITASGPVDSIVFADGQVFYSSGNPNGSGTVGTINLSTGQETPIPALTDLPGIHGMVYDSYSGDLITSGAGSQGGYGEILQINPVTETVVGSLSVNLAATDSSVSGSFPGAAGGYFDVYDLPWADGSGQIFVSANDGQMTFVDYAATGNIQNSADIVQTVPVVSWLDDVVGVVTSSTPGCAGGSGDPDQNGDVNSNYHNGHGEDVGTQDTVGQSASACCGNGDPDQNGDVHSNNHNGHGEDNSGQSDNGCAGTSTQQSFSSCQVQNQGSSGYQQMSYWVGQSNNGQTGQWNQMMNDQCAQSCQTQGQSWSGGSWQGATTNNGSCGNTQNQGNSGGQDQGNQNLGYTPGTQNGGQCQQQGGQ